MVALGKGMAETVVAQRHLWLTPTELPEVRRSEFLHQTVEPSELFGQAMEMIQACCDQRKKQKEALRLSMPTCTYTQLKPPSEQRPHAPIHSLAHGAPKRSHPWRTTLTGSLQPHLS